MLGGVKRFGILAVAILLAIAVRLALGHDAAKYPDLTAEELAGSPPLMTTSQGPYVCPVRGLVAGIPPYPAPEKDPACHRQTKLEAAIAAERTRLLARPEVAALRRFGSSIGHRVVGWDEVERFLADHPDLRRWFDHHPNTLSYLLRSMCMPSGPREFIGPCTD
jgi:hypothetical protein